MSKYIPSKIDIIFSENKIENRYKVRIDKYKFTRLYRSICPDQNP
jgi:hypothetical protein